MGEAGSRDGPAMLDTKPIELLGLFWNRGVLNGDEVRGTYPLFLCFFFLLLSFVTNFCRMDGISLLFGCMKSFMIPHLRGTPFFYNLCYAFFGNLGISDGNMDLWRLRLRL